MNWASPCVTLELRINRRIAVIDGIDDVSGFLTQFRGRTAKPDSLAKDLLVNATGFFSDPAILELLERSIIPDLIRDSSESILRIWVTECSTGQETYTLAMLVQEQMVAQGCRSKLQIFASDVDPDAVAIAREGYYPNIIAGEVSDERLNAFFLKQALGYQIRPDLRQTIIFTVQDVLVDPPFSRFDMISCRNLLIYPQTEGRAKILSVFHYALRPGGILLLGNARTTDDTEGRFRAIENTERLYRRVGHGHPRNIALTPGTANPTRMESVAGRREESARQTSFAHFGQQLVLESFAPAAVLITRYYECLYTIGPIDNYLRELSWHQTSDLLAMAGSGLRPKLKAVVEQSWNKKTRIVEEAGWIGHEVRSIPFSIDVQPVFAAGEELLLVAFVKDFNSQTPRGGVNDTVPLQTLDVRLNSQLEQELNATRAELRTALRGLEKLTQERKATSKEALSENEEYQSNAEELLTSREELQSVKQELTALTSQMQETLERNRTTADDLQNVLYSTNVATLFLDLEGRIRFFTPPIQALYAIIASDLGRKLADFAALAPDDALTGDVKSVQEELEVPDREVRTAGGTWFRRRTRPYRAGSGRIEGVVITFSKIIEHKEVRRAMEAVTSSVLAAASHDLRQPLQTLALLQALLADTVIGEKAESLIARQNVTLNTVTGILDALLDINKIGAGAVLPEISVFAIDGLIERLRGEFSFRAEAKGIQLKIVFCGQSIRSDSRLLEQMVRNLIANAIKYTEKGKVLVGCRRHGATLSVEIWDTGAVMETCDLSHVSGEYHQVGIAIRCPDRGLGLGMSIVKGLGVMLDHNIRVRSRPGRGSMFAIDLPWVPRLAAKAPPQTGKYTGKLRILVVENHPDFGELLREYLHRRGYEVTKVSDGAAALDSLMHGKPGLILTDYDLPKALEVAKMVRVAVGQPVPALVLTDDISNAMRAAAGELGCVLLNKSIDLPKLHEAITSLLASPLGRGRPVIFVVEDNEDVRNTTVAVLEADDRIALGYPNGEAFLQAFRPGADDCLLIDAVLPGMSGIDVLEQLRAAGHGLPVIVITGQSEVPLAIRAMKAGASDFIMKPVGRADLLACICHAIESGRVAGKQRASEEAAAAQLGGLTQRQRDIMTRVLAGHPNKNIAADLGISQRTVENHRASIMLKTGVTSLPALARLALAASSPRQVAVSMRDPPTTF